MKSSEAPFQRSRGDWTLYLSMMLVPMPLFAYVFPWSGFTNHDKMLIYILCPLLFLIFFGFYKAFLTPSALEFEKSNFLLIKSVLYPKRVPIGEIQMVRVMDSEGQRGTVHISYEITLKSGDYFSVPSLSDMDGFIGKLTDLNPKIEIKKS